MIWRRRCHGVVRVRSAGSCVALIGLAMLATATSAYANNWVGMQRSQTTCGVRAYVNRYNPRIGAGGGSTCWVMITSSSGSAWGQVGWAKLSDWGSSPYYFYEYESSSSNGPKILSAVPSPVDVTVSDLFSITRPSGGGSLTYWINHVSQHTTSNVTWIPSINEYYAETWLSSDQLAGSTSYHEYFHSTQYYSSTGVWADNLTNNCTPYNSNSTNYGTTFPSGYPKFWVWDKRL